MLKIFDYYLLSNILQSNGTYFIDYKKIDSKKYSYDYNNNKK